MTRGNQRELARKKNEAKKGSGAKKNTQSGSERAKDMENLAAIMKAKQEKADAKKAEAAAKK